MNVADSTAQHRKQPGESAAGRASSGRDMALGLATSEESTERFTAATQNAIVPIGKGARNDGCVVSWQRHVVFTRLFAKYADVGHQPGAPRLGSRRAHRPLAEGTVCAREAAKPLDSARVRTQAAVGGQASLQRAARSLRTYSRRCATREKTR